MNSGERDAARISIRILEKEYLIACPHEERSALLDAAEFLNGKMREIRDSGKVVGLDRVAVMAALNLANDLLKMQDKERRTEAENGNRVRALRERIDAAVNRSQQLDL
ncbi:MAG: cell division protein ZapA [Gammaproteobacteria bacterium]|nr:cell division protein ZapA [Gammaproteobacteria bacterium]